MIQKHLILFLLTLGFGMAVTNHSVAQPGTASSLERQPQKLTRAPQVNKKKNATKTDVRENQNSRTKQVTPPRLTKAKKAALNQFVRQNHPQLMKLLKQLEKQDPGKYQIAMRGLLRDYERLESFRDNEERYKNGVRDWTLKSQIHLAAVKYAMNESPAQKKVLTALVNKQLNIRRDQLNAEAERLKKRMSRIDENLKRIDSNRAAEIDRLVDVATNSVKRALISKKDDRSKPNKAKPPNEAKKKNTKSRDDKSSSGK